jgi:hypothetical protein
LYASIQLLAICSCASRHDALNGWRQSFVAPQSLKRGSQEAGLVAIHKTPFDSDMISLPSIRSLVKLASHFFCLLVGCAGRRFYREIKISPRLTRLFSLRSASKTGVSPAPLL